MANTLWKPSPFYETRGNYPLDMIIVHHIGSTGGKIYGIEGTITWFTDVSVHKNKDTGAIENKVSAHYAIPRLPYKGYDVIQFVKDIDIAYHAGDSQWVVDGKTRKYINRYSIGIELEGDGNLVEYTDFQYEILIETIRNIRQLHTIDENSIVGHEDIAPSRKVDPGKLFDWMRLRKGINPPVAVVVPPIDQPTPAAPTEPATVPTGDFQMGGGRDKDGKRLNFFEMVIKIILGLFGKS